MLKRPEDIVRFAAEAAPGSWESYGRGEHPPREMVRAMRPLVDAGVLVPAAKRESGGFLYLVKRSRSVARVAVRTASRQPGRAAQSEATRVFRCLVRAACRGLPCPSNCEIARRCTITTRAARHRVQQLVAKGRIAALFDAQTGWRVVTILTGPHAGKHTMLQPFDRLSLSGEED